MPPAVHTVLSNRKSVIIHCNQIQRKDFKRVTALYAADAHVVRIGNKKKLLQHTILDYII